METSVVPETIPVADETSRPRRAATTVVRAATGAADAVAIAAHIVVSSLKPAASSAHIPPTISIGTITSRSAPAT